LAISENKNEKPRRLLKARGPENIRFVLLLTLNP
jgi:hypothetical protein